MSYDKKYNEWKKNPEEFWKKKASSIHWYKTFEKVLYKDKKNNFIWFKGGKLNTCYNCLDRHVENGLAEKNAIIYDSPITKSKKFITYNQLLLEVSKLSSTLKSLGVAKGDRVVIYMPMIPEVIVSMLACARIGAIHSVVFGGFAAQELANRITDSSPTVIIAASCGLEPNKVINYKEILDQAILLSSHTPKNQIIFQRKQLSVSLNKPGDLDWKQLMLKTNKVFCKCVELDSEDPLYILYTSGTTGVPKGIVRTNGGHAVALHNSMSMTYDVKQCDTFWAASDVGWVVGHSYIVYAPLLLGCTTVLYEGKPIGTPDAGQFWRVISEHNVSTMFTAPTAIRAIKKVDPNGEEIKKYKFKKLKYLFLAGERADPETIKWSIDHLKIPVIDHWWQTETGWSIAGNFPEFGIFEIKYGSTGKAAPGYEVEVLDDSGKNLEPEKMGNLVIRMPLPPGCSCRIWNAPNRFFEAYLEKYRGYYNTSDAGVIDRNGYISVMSRTDDIINCSGHRISTGSIEEILTSHKEIAECAVVGLKDNLKGEVPIGLLVLNESPNKTKSQIINETIALVREKLGAVVAFKNAYVVESLPKTRSGKILRSTISKILNAESFKVPATIEDKETLKFINEIYSSFSS
ncbi:AMP-binding protein [Alphaproteobacteria bacterium]|nr:AMP-binding protein [Alphaproteobacteria bacterium]